MTGQELFHALSFVDERYIAEAESASFRKIPWMKVLSAAACLCIVLTGLYAYRLLQPKGSMAPECAAPAAPAESPEEAAPMEDAEGTPLMPEQSFTEAASAEERPATDELQHIPYARLRVVTVLEDGSFEAIVEADEPMEMDTQVRAVVDPSKVPGADGEVHNDLRALHTDAQLEITDGAYDAGSNTLYVAEVTFLCRDDH